MYSSLRVVAIGRKGGIFTLSYLVALIVILFLVLCVIIVLSKSKKD